MSGSILSQEDVEEQLSFLERFLSEAGPSDEYGDAILRNQAMILDGMLNGGNQSGMGGFGGSSSLGQSAGDVDTSQIPRGVVGSSTEDIPNGERGEVLFNIDGTNYEATVEASSEIERNEVVTIVGEDNLARPSSGNEEALSLLTGAGAGGNNGLISADGYSVYETSDSDSANEDGTITVTPGKPTTLVSTGNMENGGLLLAVGATSSNDVQYFLQADGDKNIGGITDTPLGTINSPMSFPQVFGAVIPIREKVSYNAFIPEDEDTVADVAARLHVEVR